MAVKTSLRAFKPADYILYIIATNKIGQSFSDFRFIRLFVFRSVTSVVKQLKTTRLMLGKDRDCDQTTVSHVKVGHLDLLSKGQDISDFHFTFLSA